MLPSKCGDFLVRQDTDLAVFQMKSTEVGQLRESCDAAIHWCEDLKEGKAAANLRVRETKELKQSEVLKEEKAAANLRVGEVDYTKLSEVLKE